MVPTSEPPGLHRSLLVTSIGAYGDSGLGTGGLTCLHDGRAVIIDKIDSTALHEAGGTIYRFARGLQTLIGYRQEGLRWTVRLPEFRDVHDVYLAEGAFVCVSTGTNEIVWISPLGEIVRRRQYEGSGDAWHLNCLCEAGGRLCVSAFGKFSAHRGWLGQCTGTGMILDVESGEQIIGGLNGPHNPRCLEGTWVICDSHSRSLVVQSATGERRIVPLEGFTRGLAHDARFYYVGESANRKSARPPEESFIAVVDRQTLDVTHRLRVPFPEIYEIVPVSAAFAEAILARPDDFRIDQQDARRQALERQVELGLQEIEAQKARAEKWKRRKSLWQELTSLKRSIQERLTGPR